MENCNCSKKRVLENRVDLLRIISIILSAIILILSFIFKDISLYLCLISVIICGYEVFINFIKNIIHFDFFDENTLMLISSITAFILGEYSEGVFIILLFSIGEFFEDTATDRSREKIASLGKLKNKTINIFENDIISEMEPDSVKLGSIILVKRGEIVPIDGVLISECCELDVKAITGESKISTLNCGEKIYSGSINIGNPIKIKTVKEYKDSTVEKIIQAVEGANAKKSKSQNFIKKFSKIYTPTVILLALIVSMIPPLFDSFNFSKWIYKSLSFLIVSCPCALVISVPLCYFIGIGSLANKGVLVKGSKYIDELTKIKKAIFDKTGTLTTGNFVVDKIEGYDIAKELVIKIACSIERNSNHPIAKAIINSYSGDLFNVSNVEEKAGIGIKGEIDGEIYEIGNEKILKNKNKEEYYGTIIYLLKNGDLIGKIYIYDEIKSESFSLAEKLKKYNIDCIMLSGDNYLACKNVADKCKINCFYCNLLPEQKMGILEQVKGEGKVIFIGDGINDSPSIASSDVGFSMGALGSDVAIESADVVILDDNLSKIPLTIKQSKRIDRRIKVNIFGSIAIKIAIMILSLLIKLPIWISVFGDVGVLILAIINSFTVIKIK